MILVTGANGFVGAAVCARLRKEAKPFRAAVRTMGALGGANVVQVEGLGPTTDWTHALKDVKQVVHLAARVHVMKDTSADPLAEFRRVNVQGTAHLARQAAAAGVRRFVYVSSIKVNGEFTQPGAPFKADDVPAPQDAYGVSKLEAEQVLRSIAQETGMEVVVIRPPLVYGPGVKANFAAMMRWVNRGWPLPLGAVAQNQRSLVALDNLVDLVMVCLQHPAAANQTFLVSDGEDLSTAELLQRVGKALGRPARLWTVPEQCLKWGAALINRPGVYQRLCGSLQVDLAKTQQLLGWVPPVSVDQGLKQVADSLQA
jgi:UDP-glucose 4-epimerase